MLESNTKVKSAARSVPIPARSLILTRSEKIMSDMIEVVIDSISRQSDVTAAYGDTA